MNINEYVTKDYWLAAFLLATNNKLVKHTKQNGVTMFSFSITEKLNELVNQYFALEAMVNPVAYANAQRTLKSIIYGNENVNGNERRINYVEQPQNNA